MSDNGPHAGSTTYLNLRGTKGSLYEGGARVPYIFYWKGKLQAGAVTKQPFIGMDLYPTFLELAGVKKSSWPKLDGQSILPVLQNPAAPVQARTFFWHFPAYLEGGNEKRGWRQTPGSSIRFGDWKLIQNFEYNTVELFNLGNDPKEKNDLSKSNPGMTKQLLNRLHQWQKQTGAFIPTVLNPGYQEKAEVKVNRRQKQLH